MTYHCAWWMKRGSVSKKTGPDRLRLGSVCQVYGHHVEDYRPRLAKPMTYYNRWGNQSFLSDRLLGCDGTRTTSRQESKEDTSRWMTSSRSL